jgi:hypothetical protein
MEASDRIAVEIIENLPCRLDMFWKARILRLHKSEKEFLNDLRLSLCETGDKEPQGIMNLFR